MYTGQLIKGTERTKEQVTFFGKLKYQKHFVLLKLALGMSLRDKFLYKKW